MRVIADRSSGRYDGRTRTRDSGHPAGRRGAGPL